MKILLASNSPRRKELLQNLGYDFEVVGIDCDEIYPSSLLPSEIAGYLSDLKSKAYLQLQNDEVLITADTVVAVHHRVLGKPQNREEAVDMLRRLAGTTHEVYTGITVRNSSKTITKTDVARVEVEHMTEDEINFYIDYYKPFDKAGGYGIQEWLGMAKISKITGSFYTIMGLPTHLLYQILKDFESEN